MGQRTSSDYDGQSLTIRWTPIPYDQMPLSQRLAWDRMWRKLLADEPCRSQPGAESDIENQRRANDAIVIEERFDDSPND